MFPKKNTIHTTNVYVYEYYINISMYISIHTTLTLYDDTSCDFGYILIVYVNTYYFNPAHDIHICVIEY